MDSNRTRKVEPNGSEWEDSFLFSWKRRSGQYAQQWTRNANLTRTRPLSHTRSSRRLLSRREFVGALLDSVQRLLPKIKTKRRIEANRLEPKWKRTQLKFRIKNITIESNRAEPNQNENRIVSKSTRIQNSNRNRIGWRSKRKSSRIDSKENRKSKWRSNRWN